MDAKLHGCRDPLRREGRANKAKCSRSDMVFEIGNAKGDLSLGTSYVSVIRPRPYGLGRGLYDASNIVEAACLITLE